MSATAAAQLAATAAAFDSVADVYDGPVGNNGLVQRMRARLWREVERRIPPPAVLLDLGCGTGLDAAHFAARGYRVVATDLSAAMVARTRARAAAAGLDAAIDARALGAHELARLEREPVDGVYSDLGALNCVPDLAAAAADCAALLRPGGLVVASVIARVCPWEIGYHLLRGEPRRAVVRLRRGAVPVGLNGRTVWTRYYALAELRRAFAPAFAVVACRSLGLVLPPPYLDSLADRAPRLCDRLAAIEDRLGRWPLARGLGDHLLVTFRRGA